MAEQKHEVINMETFGQSEMLKGLVDPWNHNVNHLLTKVQENWKWEITNGKGQFVV